ncbi:MAG: hypothetical protein AB1714_06095 [Acidobacteriota bacterium]
MITIQGIVKLTAVSIAAGAGLFLVDRFLLWAEARGWIFYRRRKASPGTFGGAMLEIESLLEPGKHHTAIVMREKRRDQDDSGGPPDP